jgi:hypothetical protein
MIERNFSVHKAFGGIFYFMGECPFTSEIACSKNKYEVVGILSEIIYDTLYIDSCKRKN